MPTLKKILRHIPALLGVLLLGGAIYVVQREFRHLKIADISKALDAIPRMALVWSFLWTVASYGVLTFYDRLGTIYAGNVVSYARVAFASFCAYALSHNLGFAAVSGAAVRYRLYAHWGLTPLQIGKVVAFCSLTFGLGAMVLGGIVLFHNPKAVPFFGNWLPVPLMYALGGLMWAIVVAYVLLSRLLGSRRVFGHSVELPNWRMALLQVLLATVDVAVTAAIMHALLPPAAGLDYLTFLGVYLASYTAGLAANVPGGLGVFDTALLYGLSPYLAPPQIIGAIVVFRLYYYIIPLFLAGSLFTGNEVLLRGRGFLSQAARLGGLQEVTPDFAVTAATGAVGLCGLLLLCIGVIETPSDFSWIDPDFADVAATASQFIPSLIGAALIVLAIKMAQRVALAWGATIVLLLVAAVFAVVQGEHWWIPSVLAFSALLLLPFRTAFYRRAHLFSGPMQTSTAVPLFFFCVCILALAAFEPHVRWLDNDSWWGVVLSPDVPNSLRASVAFTVGIGAVALARLLHPGKVRPVGWSADSRLRYAALGAMPPAEADGVVWGEAARAAIPYRHVGGVLLGLGDPAGAPSDYASAIWRLRDLATQEGLDPAIWGAGPKLLKIYADLGLSPVRIGPDGTPLDTEHELPASSVHYLVCKAERHLQTLLPLLPELVAHDMASEGITPAYTVSQHSP